MARKYIIGTRIYEEDSERKVIVGTNILEETTAVAGGWDHTTVGVASPTKINGIATSAITKVNGIA